MEGVAANASNLREAHDQFVWLHRGFQVALLLIVLVHWGHRWWNKDETKAVGKPSIQKAAEVCPRQPDPEASPKLAPTLAPRKHTNLDIANADADAKRDRPRECCTLSAPRASVGDFGKALQHMITTCRQKRSRDRIRIFDDCEVEDKSSHMGPMKLTECRCTQFQKLRAVACITEEGYEHSMCGGSFSGETTEASGKSGCFFMRTHDNKYVLKTIEEHEFVCLKDILPHMVLYFESHAQSLLCRFVGAYSLEIDRSIVRFVVMANVLPYKAQEVYDLKGTTEDRWVDPSTKGTLKDVNFNQLGQSMVFHGEMATSLRRQLQDDAEFLGELGVMDYSLLVGITPVSAVPSSLREGKQAVTVINGWLKKSGSKEEFVFQLGIIDFLQRWTPKKVAAHWLKKAVIGCLYEIDTEPPDVYKGRFWKYLVGKIEDDDGPPLRTGTL